ncbi:hypothetical protein [Desertivirga xinjiangensis]|uniref:hypothetical protein n=1 Tax=Desertivirga xinjiangensis TaxID=539206 RepID=UPI00210CA966|nr:hypothetical protein [Pedobacter xinjiangensis]
MKSIVSIVLATALFHFNTGDDSAKPGNEYHVKIDPKTEIGKVSPGIMGFNIVYCYEGDKMWDAGKGKVAGLMKGLNPGQLRYPGGTVVTKFHWENPTGQGWKDSWDPDFDPSKNTSPGTFMDVDEYLQLVKRLKIEPLVGINMGSGMKHGNVEESLAEAVRLMQHCKKSGVEVKYYYLDNEPYQHDANFTYTAEQYGDMVNRFVPEMKKVDPDIKIIVNTHPRPDQYIRPLLQKAGKNIDYVDVHMYWKWKNATFANWKDEPLMLHQDKRSYEQQRKLWEGVFAEEGFPSVRLVVLEWNIGPSAGQAIPKEAEAALMASEQFIQYIRSGLYMSCFWPLSWPRDPAETTRALFPERQEYNPGRMYKMFSEFSEIPGNQQVMCTINRDRLIGLGIKSNDGKTVWVYLVNKNQDQPASKVVLDMKNFLMKTVEAKGFSSSGKELSKKDLITEENKEAVSLTIPVNSFVKLSLHN